MRVGVPSGPAGVRQLLFGLVVWLAAFSFSAAAQELVAIPALAQRVTDLAGALSPQQRDDLEAKLAGFEAEHGSQIAILIVTTTKPEDIESYSIRVAEAWKVGRRDVGDGVIVLVAQKDRRLRIEVAKALEGAIPDALAKRIVAETIAPRFKEGDTYGGLDQGLGELFRLIQGESLPPPTQTPTAGEERFLGLEDGIPAAVIVAVLLAGGLLRAVFGRAIAAGVAGALVGGGLWVSSGSFATGLVAGSIAFIFVLTRGLGGRRRRGFLGRMSRGWRSGGGGDFGGGGASGGW